MNITVGRAAVIASALTFLTVAAPSAASASDFAGTAFGQPCAPVTILVVPGSRETNDGAGMDVAKGMLKDVTEKLGDHDASIRIHFLGYPAHLVPYGASRAHGYDAAWSTVKYYADQCPSTSFILAGYSQGAHVAGDLAATIGKEGSPVTSDRVRSVRLLADPARDPGTSVVGTGGASGGLFGHRGDFGKLNGSVTEYCNRADVVCNDAVNSGVSSLSTWFGAHTSYQTATIPKTGETYTRKMADDITQDVLNLNSATY